jgi:hypothetical protein
LIRKTPLLELSLPVKASASDGYTSVIVGGHSPECRWYSEDGVNLADIVKVTYTREITTR